MSVRVENQGAERYLMIFPRGKNVSKQYAIAPETGTFKFLST